MVTIFKAIQLEPATRQRTGREYALEAVTRQAAVDELLGLLQVASTPARIDPSRTLVQLDSELWTIVGVAPNGARIDEPSSLRRAGAKHRRVR